MFDSDLITLQTAIKFPSAVKEEELTSIINYITAKLPADAFIRDNSDMPRYEGHFRIPIPGNTITFQGVPSYQPQTYIGLDLHTANPHFRRLVRERLDRYFH